MTFCGSHLWCWWSLFSKYCVWSWIIFHKVTSEYNSAFVLWILRLQLRILEMTEIHQWRKMNFFCLHSLLHRSPLLLFLTFASCHAGIFSNVPIIFSTAAFAYGFFQCLRHRIKCVYQIVCSGWVNLFLSLHCDLHDTFQELLPIEFSWTRQLRQYKHIFVLPFPNTAVGIPTAVYWTLTRHCRWHRNFQLSSSSFHGTFEFIVWLNEEDIP